MGYEGYTLVLNTSTEDHKVMCSSETVQEFLDCEEERKQPIEENFFKYMCGKCTIIIWISKGGPHFNCRCQYEKMWDKVSVNVLMV